MAMKTAACAMLLLASLILSGDTAKLIVPPGSRVMADAHNCYPYNGRWKDRIDRALKAGVPVAIEQDLYWYTDPKTGVARSIVSHGANVDGTEPSMRDYFFERIRPIMEQALAQGNRGDWPLITLNLDFKTDEPQHHAAVWKLLGEYEGWLSTAVRSADPYEVTPITAGPLLVLTGEADSQEHDFYDIVPLGAKLRLFGAVRVNRQNPLAAPNVLVTHGATNYRRWWNNAWNVVEKGGQTKAGEWSNKDDKRLRSLVNWAHEKNLYIRFYTLDGTSPQKLNEMGWDAEYNFSPEQKVVDRWRAAIETGVDYIATDQVEDLAAFLARMRNAPTLGH